MQTTFLVLTVVAMVLGQVEKSPLEGRWTADLPASRLHPGVSVRSITLDFAVSPDRVRIIDDVVLASGERVGQGPAVFLTDGREHPNDALRPGLVVRAHWPNPRRLETVLTRPGIVERVTYEVSSDGDVLTNTTEGPLGKQVIVFRRP